MIHPLLPRSNVGSTFRTQFSICESPLIYPRVKNSLSTFLFLCIRQALDLIFQFNKFHSILYSCVINRLSTLYSRVITRPSSLYSCVTDRLSTLYSCIINNHSTLYSCLIDRFSKLYSYVKNRPLTLYSCVIIRPSTL